MSNEVEQVSVAEVTPPTPEEVALQAKNLSIDNAEGENKETTNVEAGAETPPKIEKSSEQKEIERLRKAVDRKTRQREEARAESAQLRQRLTTQAESAYSPSANDSDTLSLTKAQIDEMVNAEAQRRAVTLKDQDSERERRERVIKSLAKTWGSEKFDEVSSDLEEALGGLRDSSGRPKAVVEAVFESENPAKVIEWLANPENLDEAERFARLSAVQAGREIAKLELKLSDKPAPSKAPAPIEAVKGSGQVTKRLGDMSFQDFVKRRREQIANRH